MVHMLHNCEGHNSKQDNIVNRKLGKYNILRDCH